MKMATCSASGGVSEAKPRFIAWLLGAPHLWFSAWMWTFGIVEVQTRQRVLENGRRFPGGAYGASIATLLQKAEFELEDFQDVTFVVRHRAPPGMAPVRVRTIPTSIRGKPIVGDRATQAL